MPTRRLVTWPRRGCFALLVSAMLLVLGIQVWWAHAAARLAGPAGLGAITSLSVVDEKAEAVVAALKLARTTGDLRHVKEDIALLEAELGGGATALGGLNDARLIELRTGLAALTRALARMDDEGLPGAEAQALVLREPAAEVAAIAREEVSARLRRLADGAQATTALTGALALCALGGIVWRDRSFERVLRRQASRHRQSLATRRRLQHEADHDPLTNLANRRRLLRELAERTSVASHGGDGFALHLLDLDGLKRINDDHGHHAGDTVLQAVARALEASVRSGDRVGRLAGDEFVVVQNGADIDAAARLAWRLRERVREAVALDDGRLVIPTVCIGTAIFGRDGRSADALLRAADAFLYKAKGLVGHRAA